MTDVRNSLEDAVRAVDAIVELLSVHGPSTCNTGLRRIADIGRQGLDGTVDAGDAATEMQRMLRSMAGPFSDIVVHSDDDVERIRLNEMFNSLATRMSDYRGPVANQGGIYVGGGQQVYVEAPWNGGKVIDSWPLK